MNYIDYLKSYFTDNNFFCEDKYGEKYELNVTNVVEDGDDVYFLGEDTISKEKRFIKVNKFKLEEMMKGIEEPKVN